MNKNTEKYLPESDIFCPKARMVEAGKEFKELLIGNYADNPVKNNGFVTRPWEARTYLF